MNHWGWSSGSNASSNVIWPAINMTSGSGVVYPYYYGQPQQLAPVLESPSARLDDREWLDAQIAEVCNLAEAA